MRTSSIRPFQKSSISNAVPICGGIYRAIRGDIGIGAQHAIDIDFPEVLAGVLYSSDVVPPQSRGGIRATGFVWHKHAVTGRIHADAAL